MTVRGMTLLAGAGAALALMGMAGAANAQRDDGQPEIYYPFAALDGEQVTGGGSDEGYGDFSAELDAEKGTICYMLAVGDVEMTAAHIHQGKAGEDGPPVVTLENTGADAKTCTEIDTALLRKIGGKPRNYYVNVHTADFPAGAIRGQLEE